MQKKYLGLILLTACFLAGCGAQQTEPPASGESKSAEREIFAMDTYMTLKTYGAEAEEAAEAAVEEINRLDGLLSAENQESEIYILNENGSEILSEETAQLIERAKELNRSTGGAFDITVYPLMTEWGFNTGKYKVPKKNRIKQLLTYVDSSRIEYDKNNQLAALPEHVKVDLGGIAKGYTSSRIMDIYKEYGLTGGMVSLGGNVQTYGGKPEGGSWNVAVQNPDYAEESTGYLGILSLDGGEAVITSGGYERYFEQAGRTWHHILDPETGYPAETGLKSVTIISRDGTLADGLSTALFVMGKEKALAYWKENKDLFDVILMGDDGTITVTGGVSDSFSSDYQYEIVKG